MLSYNHFKLEDSKSVYIKPTGERNINENEKKKVITIIYNHTQRDENSVDETVAHSYQCQYLVS